MTEPLGSEELAGAGEAGRRAADLGGRMGATLSEVGPLLRYAGSAPGVPAADAPLVSVVIATYNWGNVLPYAIRSVLAQSYPNLEVLVIGDGCTDDTAEVVASFSDLRVRWHDRGENSGNQSAPNNDGIERARGEYVAYLGHDDLWHPSHLALLVPAMRRAGAGVGYTTSVFIGPRGSNIRKLVGPSTLGRYEPGHWIPPSAFMHRREVALEIGGWRDYRTIAMAPDTEFLARASAQAKTIGLRALTLFKFPSSYRRDVYRTRPHHEQAEYERRIQRRRAFLARELLAVAAVRVRGRPEHYPEQPEAPDPLPPGWIVDQARRVRGLPAGA